MAQEFWLISTPGEKNQTQNNVAWEKMNHATSIQSQLSSNTKFNIPDLKVGTLDQLVGLSDDLAKQDTYVEGVTRKMANYLGDILEDQRDKLGENLLAGQKKLPAYLQSFSWEAAKFPTKQSLRGIVDAINNQVTQIEQDLKSKSANYNNLKTTLANMERKQTGSIMTRSLGDIVKKDFFVHNSEYLVTLLVVVPKLFYNDWQTKYENLTDMVVPRSSKMIYEDADHGLFTVTVFLKVVDEFKLHARENKFVVRDFTYNEEELAAGKNELSKLISDKKKHFGPLVRWIKVNFSECFLCYTHVKAIRVFVESVLRYGLPVNFQPALLQVSKKNIKRLRDVLNNLYSHLDSTASETVHAADVDIPGLGFSTGDYYPYVFFKINVDFTDHRI